MERIFIVLKHVNVKRFLLLAAIAAAFFLWRNQYLFCPDVACILRQDDELSARFDPDTPIFLDWSHSSQLLTAVPELAGDPAMHHMLDKLTENVKRMRQMTTAHSTCAVVGNSQNLRNSHYGPKIDAHDYVFRMNSAPIASFEDDVGSRTTHHIFSHFFGHYVDKGKLDIRTYGAQTFNILLPAPDDIKVNQGPIYQSMDYRDYQYFFANLAHALTSQESPTEPLSRTNLTELRNVPNLLLLSPDFMWYANLTWFQPDKKQKRDRASTGFDTIILALQLCDRVTLFGFGADKRGNWGHYFKVTQNNNPAIHRTTYQDEFIHELQKKHIVTVYPGV